MPFGCKIGALTGKLHIQDKSIIMGWGMVVCNLPYKVTKNFLKGRWLEIDDFQCSNSVRTKKKLLINNTKYVYIYAPEIRFVTYWHYIN